ncbi:HEAT repeat domain-containing protein [Scytonema tolypothrichoides VB-61278_2]|uniref:Leucine rich repeat variant n=2 Tax=Nostocales TaxID=1161 RepID=A0A0C1N410_9CYAN
MIPDNQNQPSKFDVVLGDRAPLPIGDVVLGGMEGVKRRLKSTVVEARLTALGEAFNYGEAGINLIIETLKDESKQVRLTAARLLREKGSQKEKQILIDCDPWLFFTTLEGWNQYTAVRTTKQLVNLLQEPQITTLEALVCEIEKNGSYGKFQDFVNVLVATPERLPYLKALFMGDPSDSKQWKRGYSQICLSNINPILKAFPHLQVLHLCGFFGHASNPILKNKQKQELLQIRNRDGSPVVSKKTHTELKTLIIEGADLTDEHVAEICQLEYPSLEYLELWLGRRDTEKIVKSLAPLLSGKSCPNLIYLGLIGSENTNAIARAISCSEIIKRLKVLDLGKGKLTVAGVTDLLKCPTIENLHTLNVSENCLRPIAIEQLSHINCQVIANSQFHDSYRFDDDSARYYTAWE